MLKVRSFRPIYVLTGIVLLVIASFAGASRPQARQDTTSAQPWDAGTRYPDWTAPSTLTITNDCKRSHDFSITPENAPFLDLLGVTHVSVPAKKSIELPVRFHTDGMAPGTYAGLVTIICLDCREVPPCTQDRKTVAPHVTVIARPAGTTPPPTTPPTSVSHDCNDAAKNCDELRKQVAAKEQASQQASAKMLAAIIVMEAAYEEADDACGYAEEGDDYAEDLIWSHSGIEGYHLPLDLTDELNRAWKECDEAEEDAEHAEAIARGLAAVAEAAQDAYDQAVSAYKECETNLAKSSCPVKPADLSLGQDFWQPWPAPPTKPKPEWPKSGATSTAPGAPPGTPPVTAGGGGVTTNTVEHPGTRTKEPCSEQDCEELRRVWLDKQAEAQAAQANADNAASEAATAEAAAAKAEQAAAAAAAAVPKIDQGSSWMESGGIRLTSHDLKLASAASQQAFADYQAGKISADQLQDIWGKSGDAAAISKLHQAEQDAVDAAQMKADEAAQAAAAAKAVADGARANALKAQQAADQAKAAATAAQVAYENCVKCHTTETAGGGTSGGGATTGGGTPPGGGTACGGTTTGGATTTGGDNNPQTQSNDCPPFPENCDALRAQYEQLKQAADVAQAQADREKEQQQWNNQQADGLDKFAGSVQASADADTAHAQQWRQMAGSMAGLAQSALQHRNAFAAGSNDYASWDQMYQDDLKEAAQRNQWADELEESERNGDMKAAQLRAQAAQLRNASSDAQAAADKAKADADAAYKAWQDCLARKQAYDEDCKRKAAAAIPTTVTRPTPPPAKPKPTLPPTTTSTPPDDTGQVDTPKYFKLADHNITNSIVVDEPRVDHPGLTIDKTKLNVLHEGGFTYICKAPGTYRVTIVTDDGRRHTIVIVCHGPQ